MQQEVAKGRRNSLAILTTGLAAVLFTSGCGNQYRPVVTAINPVGPASQPTKYAIAISNPSAAAAGCGLNYGAGQGETGLITVVDVSGDTVLSTPNIGPASNNNFFLPPSNFSCPINPNIFSIDLFSGSQGVIIDPSAGDFQGGGGFAEFPISNPTSLLSQDVVQTALATGANPTSVEAIAVGSNSTGATVFVTQAGSAATSTSATVAPSIAALSAATGASLLQTIQIPDSTNPLVFETPVYVVGYDGAQRVYALSQNAAGNGEATAIEGTQLAISATLPIGKNPVYGVMTPDVKRAYILNKGDSTVSVINVVNNALDTGVQYPQQPNGTTPPVGTIPLAPGVNPVWADYSLTTNELVVLNQGDGVNPGSLSIINIPLCNINTPVTNPNCNAANPTDAQGFGQIVATVPVGVNPTMVSMLTDGTQAYVVNSGNATTGAGASVSVVNLATGVVTATIPYGADTPDTPTKVVNTIFGHPNTVSATTGSPTGKVYITSSDDNYLTILRTDNNNVQAHIDLQGAGVRVQVNTR